MKSFQVTSPIDGASFSAGSVIGANGKHSLDTNNFVWAVLQDVFGHYYLQNPPVTLSSDGNWRAENIHLGHDITGIVFVRVNTNGNEVFLKKVKNNDWGAFDEFPPQTEELGSINIKVS